MKRGIELWSDYDKAGRWCLHLKKKKGRFTLDEIQEALTEYELDFYFLFLNCSVEQNGDDFMDEPGDFITVYRAEEFMREVEHGQECDR